MYDAWLQQAELGLLHSNMEPGPSKVDSHDCGTFSAFACVRAEDGSAVSETGDNYDDDFGDFATATATFNANEDLGGPPKEVESALTNWADFRAAVYPSSSGSTNGSLSANNLIDQFDRLVLSSFPDVVSGSEGPKFAEELETLAALLNESDAESRNVQASECYASEKLWRSLRSVEDATALHFKWNDSLLYSIYLTTLGMNLQLAQTTKCPYPAFAAQLSKASLKPEKCADIVALSPVLSEPASLTDFSFADANSSTFQLLPPASNESWGIPPKPVSGEANPFSLDIFSLSVDEAISAGKPTWQEDLEQLGLMGKRTGQEPKLQSLSNGSIGAVTKCVPKATVNVLPVLPPPPAGMLVRHKLEPK